VILQLSEEGGLEASLASAYSLAEEMSAWPCVEKIRSLATGTLQIVANLFAEALHLDNAVLSGDTPWPAATTTFETLRAPSWPEIPQGRKMRRKPWRRSPAMRKHGRQRISLLRANLSGTPGPFATGCGSFPFLRRSLKLSLQSRRNSVFFAMF